MPSMESDVFTAESGLYRFSFTPQYLHTILYARRDVIMGLACEDLFSCED